MMFRCSTHRAMAAGWMCTLCNRHLCPDCAALQPIRYAGDATICVHCAGPASLLTVPRKIEPYWVAFPVFLRNMVTPAGATQLLAVAVAFYVTTLLGNGGAGLRAFIYASYFFQIVNRAAHGEEKLPLPADFLGIQSFGVSTRYALASFLIWGPALIYALRDVSVWELVGNFEYVLRERIFDPVVLLIICAGIFYYPAALIAGAVAESFWAMLAPWITIRMILRIPGQYFLTVVVIAVLGVIDLVWSALLDALDKAVLLPVFVPLAVILLKLPIRLLMAFILGRLIFQNAEHFGVVREGELQLPVLPGAVPRGKRAGGQPAITSRP